jgi:hypothetical protein
METCDVCLQDAPPVVAGRFSAVDEDDVAPVTVLFCFHCSRALFELLERRHRDAVEDGNRAVSQALRILGIPSDLGEK